MTCVNEIASAINTVLASHCVAITIFPDDLVVTENYISDLPFENAKLSDAVTQQIFPSISKAEVFHYTSRNAAESILNTGILRFTSIEKRFSEGEIVSFCKAHGLDGYLALDTNSQPTYRTLLMPNTFYASFTDTKISDEDEKYFWSTFAGNNGVRLRFRVVASNPNFRQMVYGDTRGRPIPLLADLSSMVRSQFNRQFVLKGMSRLCAFYLQGGFAREREYRAMHRVWEPYGPQPVVTGANSYIEIPLGSPGDCGYEFYLTEVHAETRPNMPNRYAFSMRGLP